MNLPRKPRDRMRREEGAGGSRLSSGRALGRTHRDHSKQHRAVAGIHHWASSRMDQLESLFAGSAIAISSTTIIAKAFDEQKIGGRLRDLVVGILLVEDLIAIVLMAALTPVASGSGLSAGVLAATAGRLFVFLAALIGIGLLIVPRATRAVMRLESAETTLVASL